MLKTLKKLICFCIGHKYVEFMGRNKGTVIQPYWCERCKDFDTLHGRLIK